MDKIKQAKLNARKPKSENDLFRFVGKEKKLVHVNLLNEVHKGRSVSDYLNELDEANSLIEASIQALTSILKTNGYEVKGNSGKIYFVIEPENNNNNFKIYEVLPNNNFNYLCIVNKTNKGHIGKDALVSRLYALKNDTLVAKDIYTLKV